MLQKSELILITGGHGFIVCPCQCVLPAYLTTQQGGHVARRLHAGGYRIRVADIVAPPPDGQKSVGEVLAGNLCDPLFCAKAVQGVSVVLHFAATMAVSFRELKLTTDDPTLYARAGCNKTAKVLCTD